MKSVLHPENWAETAARIGRITPDSPRQWGKMNAHEMLVHCTDQVRLALGEKTGPRLGSWLLENVVIRLILLGMPAPKGKVETLKELKQGAGGTRPAAFDQDRDTLLAAVETFRTQDRKPHPHPAFGDLSRTEWGKLIWTHLDHHLRQFGA